MVRQLAKRRPLTAVVRYSGERFHMSDPFGIRAERGEMGIEFDHRTGYFDYWLKFYGYDDRRNTDSLKALLNSGQAKLTRNGADTTLVIKFSTFGKTHHDETALYRALGPRSIIIIPTMRHASVKKYGPLTRQLSQSFARKTLRRFEWWLRRG
ncbi:hypothetical protein B7Z17_05075, partial [Candidatus Saccharibacteria bacterium 32-49-10]